MRRPRTPAALLAATAVAALAAAALPAGAGPTAAGSTTAETAGASAPEGGPVDDGWLPADGAAFSQFDQEPPPAGGPVWPGVRRDVRTTSVGSGQPVDVQILHVDPGADVTIQPTLAGGSVRGLATVAAQSGDPLDGMVAATNGAFWLRDPVGEPNGYLARDGRLISDAESQGVGPRGTVGWTADGRVLIDRVDSLETLTLPDGSALEVDGINRGHRDYDEPFADGGTSLLAYTVDYGGTASLVRPRRPPEHEVFPPIDLAVLRLDVPLWPAAGSQPARVVAVERDVEGTYTPGPGEVLLLATGDRAIALDGVQEGDTVLLGTRIQPLDPALEADWATVVRGLAGGPQIVEGGRMTDPLDWVDEGFEPHVHSDVRAPRTAIGYDAEGRVLLVVADGRRPGVTVGFTIAELARYMIALGAVDALSLDGGASSQVVVDGILRNVPCCDTSTRVVADSLQIVHDEPFDGTDRLRGAGRVDTAAAIARHAHPDGAEVAVLAAASTFPDALAGGPLAAVLGGPLLLSGRDGVPRVTLDVLAELGVDRAVLLGGDGVLGEGVAADLAAAGITTARVAGGSRFDTAAAIAGAVDEEVEGPPTRAFLASARSFADALVAAGPGGILGMPILLTEPGTLHPSTLTALDEVDEVVVVGGTAQVSEAVVDRLRTRGLDVIRLAGTGRFGTARAVNDWLADQVDLSDGLVVATGDDFPDALAGGPLAAALRAPLMIVPGERIDADPDAAAWFEGLTPRSDVDVLGGLGVVSSYQQWQLEQLTSGGSGVVEGCELPVDPLGTCPG
jgi:putative cell wall-binding protein